MSVHPALSIQSTAMRPITKITILGVRLAVIALIVYWLLIFTGTHLPTVPDIGVRLNDKIKHFVAFFGLGTLLCYVTNSRQLIQRFGCIGLIGMTYAALDELTQKLVAGRTADVMDFAADSAGLWSAIAVYAFARVFVERWRNTPDRLKTESVT
jgi:VanZ family protein